MLLFRLERKVRWMLWSPMMLEMERLVVLDEIVDVQNRFGASSLNVIFITNRSSLRKEVTKKWR